MNVGYIYQNHVLFKLDRATGRFIQALEVAQELNSISIFSDDIGNKVYAYKKREEKVFTMLY